MSGKIAQDKVASYLAALVVTPPQTPQSHLSGLGPARRYFASQSMLEHAHAQSVSKSQVAVQASPRRFMTQMHPIGRYAKPAGRDLRNDVTEYSNARIHRNFAFWCNCQAKHFENNINININNIQYITCNVRAGGSPACPK